MSIEKSADFLRLVCIKCKTYNETHIRDTLFKIHDTKQRAPFQIQSCFFRHRRDRLVDRPTSELDFQSATRPAAVEPVRAEERGLTLRPAIFDTRQPIRLSD